MAAPAGAAGVSGEPGVAVVTELARRFAAGDGAGAAALFHPEIRIQQPETMPHGGWHRGPQGMAAMGAEFGRHWTRRIGEPRILGCGAAVVHLLGRNRAERSSYARPGKRRWEHTCSHG